MAHFETSPRPRATARSPRVSILLRQCAAGDLSAREELVHHFLPLAHRLAGRYRQSREAQQDLEQVAALGLLKAIDRYRPDAGPFVPYAVPTILGELKRHFRDRAWGMHVQRSLQERVIAVGRAGDELGASLGRSPTPNDLAQETGLTLDEVLEALEASDAYSPAALDAPISSSAEAAQTLGDSLGAEDRGYELVELTAAVAPALARLAPLDRTVLHLRFIEDLTQSEIGQRVGIGQMQVSRILRSTLRQLNQAAGAHRDSAVRAVA